MNYEYCWLAILPCILLLTGEVCSQYSCGHYVTNIDNNTGVRNLRFRSGVEDGVHSFFVGFLFGEPVKNVEVYGSRLSYKVNETLWFVTKNESFQTFIDFVFKVTFVGKLNFNQVTVNGDVVCSETPKIRNLNVQNPDPSTLLSLKILIYMDIHTTPGSTGNMILQFVSVILISTFGISLVGLITWLKLSLAKFAKKTEEYWVKIQCTILAMERRLSTPNPNTKMIPLPKIPRHNSKRGTYITLDNREDIYLSRYVSLIELLKHMPEKVLDEHNLSEYVVLEELPNIIPEEEEEENFDEEYENEGMEDEYSEKGNGVVRHSY